MKVWIVEDTNLNKEVVGSAEKAYEVIKWWLMEVFDRPEDADELTAALAELDEGYKDYPDNFAVEDFAWAEAYNVT